jgi:hypothetical protein
MDNKISVTLANEAQTAILQAIATIEKNLPFLINLTNEERQANPKMGDKSLAFVNKACEYAKQNPALVPVFLDIAEFEKDVAAANSLSNLLKPLAQLTEKLDDTTLQAGSEAYTAALIFYTAAKGAAKAGMPGIKSICDDLSTRFPGRSKASSSPSVSSN